MEMHQVRYFVALCETLNFTRAAERCNVTQPSLTRAVKLLEEELGGLLFNRERNQTHLTELGRTMAPHLREILDQAQSARARASSFKALRSPRLKLGVARGVTLAAVQDTLRSFVARHPDTEIVLHDDLQGELREALRRGDFEIVVLPQQPQDLDDLHHYSLAREAAFAILPEGHELARLDEVPLAELARADLICGEGCPFWEIVAHACAEVGLAVTPKAIATRVEWLLELVDAGVGIGICAAQPKLPPGVIGRPIAGAAMAHEITLTTKRGRLYSPPVKAFVEIALRPCRQPAQAA